MSFNFGGGGGSAFNAKPTPAPPAPTINQTSKRTDAQLKKDYAKIASTSYTRYLLGGPAKTSRDTSYAAGLFSQPNAI